MTKGKKKIEEEEVKDKLVPILIIRNVIIFT